MVARIASRDLTRRLTSARSASSSAETALAIARSERSAPSRSSKAARSPPRSRAGENAVSNAKAQLAAARARLSVRAAADRRHDRARAVRRRGQRPAANPGDVVSPGTALVTIIDPSSMRLEALCRPIRFSRSKPGAPSTSRSAAIDGRVRRQRRSRQPVRRSGHAPGVDLRVAAEHRRPARSPASSPKAASKPRRGRASSCRCRRRRDRRGRPSSRASATAKPSAWPSSSARADRADRTGRDHQRRLAAGDVLIVGSAKGIAPGTPVTSFK